MDSQEWRNLLVEKRGMNPTKSGAKFFQALYTYMEDKGENISQITYQEFCDYVKEHHFMNFRDILIVLTTMNDKKMALPPERYEMSFRELLTDFIDESHIRQNYLIGSEFFNGIKTTYQKDEEARGIDIRELCGLCLLWYGISSAEMANLKDEQVIVENGIVHIPDHDISIEDETIADMFMEYKEKKYFLILDRTHKLRAYPYVDTTYFLKSPQTGEVIKNKPTTNYYQVISRTLDKHKEKLFNGKTPDRASFADSSKIWRGDLVNGDILWIKIEYLANTKMIRAAEEASLHILKNILYAT